MIEFFRSNTLIFVAIILIVVFVVLFLVIKYSKSKSATVTKVFGAEKTPGGDDGESGGESAPAKSGTESRDTTESSEPLKKETEGESEETPEVGESDSHGDEAEETDQQQKKTKEKEKKVKSVEKVFKLETAPDDSAEEVVSEPNSSISEEELLSKMQFVKDTKKVSKLVKLSEQERAALEEPIDQQTPEQFVPESYSKPVTDAPKKSSKYFNRDRRLSRFIEQNNFDDMFDSHISDRYLNIDASRHLDVTDEKTNRLYERASKTVANSDVRLVYGGDETGANLKRDKKLEESFIEKRKREIFAEMIETKDNIEAEVKDYVIDENSIDDEIKLDSKTVLVSDAILRRKGKRKK